MRDYQQHFRTRRKEIPIKRKISVPFHTPEFNCSEIPYPLIVISEAWKLLSRASPYMSLQGVLPHTQFRNSLQVVRKLTSRLVWSGSFLSFWVQTCYSHSTSSMEPFLFWSPQFIEMENKASGFEKQSHMLISKWRLQ